MISECKWQWMDATYGGMGWFSDADKKKHEGTPEFSNGEWRAIPPDEVEEMSRSIGRLAYEQS